jgi:hypothetical protein
MWNWFKRLFKPAHQRTRATVTLSHLRQELAPGLMVGATRKGKSAVNDAIESIGAQPGDTVAIDTAGQARIVGRPLRVVVDNTLREPAPVGEFGPPPQEALALLLAGKPLKVNGHRVIYDEADGADGVTWYTNAYGLDGIICPGKPTLEVVTQFLDDMAAGIDYGMTPT